MGTTLNFSKEGFLIIKQRSPTRKKVGFCFPIVPVHDVNALDYMSFEANRFYIMCRGYVDIKRLYKILPADAFFVTRTKDNMNSGGCIPIQKIKIMVCFMIKQSGKTIAMLQKITLKNYEE